MNAIASVTDQPPWIKTGRGRGVQGRSEAVNSGVAKLTVITTSVEESGLNRTPLRSVQILGTTRRASFCPAAWCGGADGSLCYLQGRGHEFWSGVGGGVG